MLENLTIGSRICKVRKERNLTQQAFADILGVSRGIVTQIEGDRIKPTLEILTKIVNYTNISYEYFLEGKISGNEKFEQNQEPKETRNVPHDVPFMSPFGGTNAQKPPKTPEKGREVLHDLGASKKQMQVLPIVVEKSNDERIVAVPHYAEAGYTAGYSDSDYIRDLPTFSIPWLRDGTYRAFQIRGDSMETDLKSGDWVIGRYVTTLKSLQIGTICVVLLRDEGIICKRVEKERGTGLLLHSNNEKYKPIKPDSEDILEMWEVKVLMRNFYH
jgi:transcriptional regulator with XRE-family HTH domain/phage repressor protein C with HTH and peptisase S24 domain